MSVVPNKIREFRVAKGLSQSRLAALVGTSQQQIQRIESGVQTTKAWLAISICNVLGVKLNQAFPRIDRPVKAAMKRTKRQDVLDQRGLDEIERAGVDMRNAQWRFVYELRGGTSGFFWVAHAEMERLKEFLHDDDEDLAGEFFVFDSLEFRVAVNPAHILHAQLLFDVGLMNPENRREMEVGPCEVAFHFAPGGKTVGVEMDPDSISMSEGVEQDEDPHRYQLQEMFAYLGINSGFPRLAIVDMDGEENFMRIADVALIVCPLRLVEVDLYAAEDDEDDDEDDDDDDDYFEDMGDDGDGETPEGGSGTRVLPFPAPGQDGDDPAGE